MDAELQHFGIAYRRFVRVAATMQALMPTPAPRVAARFLGRGFSPYRLRKEKILASMKQALALDAPSARSAWQNWLDSHGMFGLNAFACGRPVANWLVPMLSVQEPHVLKRIVRSGGLVLTYHSHHHNTLGCVLGSAGCHITGLAASPSGSPLYPFIGPAMDRINVDSSAHFGGGTYLYTDEPRLLVRETNRLLREGKVVVSLHDFHQESAQSGQEMVSFLGRLCNPPTGALEIAMKLRVPVFAALLTSSTGILEFTAREIETTHGSPMIVMQEYFDFLADRVRSNPSAWQGWDWYHAMPENSKQSGPNRSPAATS